jgi:putative ABC transport system permease protein
MLLTPGEIKDAILMAFSALSANKLRSALTILGVMVGVGSVIGMAAVIDGLNDAAEGEIDRMGTNIIMVQKFGPNTDFQNLTDEERNRPWITAGEAQAIVDHCPSVDGVSPQNYYFKPGGNEAKFKNRKFNRPMFFGTWPDYEKVRNKDLAYGRFFNRMELQMRAMVCVIGYDVADVLFLEYGEDPVGQFIRLNGDKMLVVGVIEDVESNFGNDNDNRTVAIPLTTYNKLIPWEKELSLAAKAVSHDKIDQAKEEIISALRAYRKVPFNKPNNFALSTQDQFKEMVGEITQYIYLAGLVITCVGLMVGGIGVMNIMLVSVTERTREIGVRKAIGAKRSNIILQFLTEATTLSGSGGVIGIVGGILLGVLVNSLLGFPLSVSVFWMVVGFVVAVSVGLVSGVYPAVKAARLDPIEALRYE